ncbi:MAG TPA: tetratricopeptide repeat protein, partial [Gammaproteobacteria bacterium]|nr:tetratricopeptide repeat protein [Gammaproteobacteria bacterium]
MLVIVRIFSKSALLLIALAALVLSACQPRPDNQNAVNEAAMARLQSNSHPPENQRGQLLYHLMVAELALRNKQLDLAASEYLLAARLGNSAEVAERAMRIALLTKKNDTALRAARRWVELEPEPGKKHARQALALLYLRTNQLDKAADELDYLVKSADEKLRETVILQISGILSQEEDLESASTLMSKFKTRYPDSANVDYGMALLAMKAGQTELAQQSIKLALDKRPGEQSYQELHARILMHQGKQAEALKVLETVLAQYSDSRRLRISYARLLALAGKYDDAVAQFEMLLKKQPNDADLLYAAALLAVEVGKLKKAEAYLHRVLVLKTRINDAHYYLGRIAEKRSHFDQAIQWYT